MDYREQSKDLLSRKKNLVSAYNAIKTELQHLENEKIACKTIASNSSLDEEKARAVYEERLINILADIDDCRFRLSVVERELLKIEKGMLGLSDYQRDIIETFFVERVCHAVDDLMERWYKERSSIYRDRTRALDQFTRSVFGVLQL